MVFGKIWAPKPKTLEQRLDAKTSQRRGAPVNYAVLFSGQSGPIYESNLSMAYRTAIINGYLPEDIFIFDSTGQLSSHYPVTDVASWEALRMTTRFLSEGIGEEDLLFFYMTGHGDRMNATTYNEDNHKKKERISTVDLPHFWGEIDELEVARWLSAIHPRSGVLVFDQCYSGGFAQRAGIDNYVALSASEFDKESMDNTFPRAFFGVYNRMGLLPNIRDAFDIAVSKDSNALNGKQTPQIFSAIDSRSVFLSYKGNSS